MSRYEVQDDPLCYPGTQVLRNNADLKSQDHLDQFEHMMFLTRADEPLPPGNLDFDHYKAIHHHFFQDVYEWAGEARTIRTGKGGNWFCFPEYIYPEMTRLFDELREEDFLTGTASAKQFAERASYFVAEINAVRPFREGNGRCQLTLLSILCDLAGFEMDEARIDPSSFLSAMVASFSGETRLLSEAIILMIGTD
jgi:cell filamentation protein